MHDLVWPDHKHVPRGTTYRVPLVPKTLQGKRVYYPADDAVVPFKRICKTPAPSKGRKCIVPGSVIILLSGRFRGRRVVVLKSLKSGLLLVTGPYKINGVPLKRVNPAYCIPTSSKLNVANVNVSSVDDAWFAKDKVVAGKKGEEAFFANSQKVNVRSDAKKATQKTVDATVLELVKKQDTHFALSLIHI